ncbi:MAG TPA: ATP-binding protein, partial [Dehalococcoidia bacterium]
DAFLLGVLENYVGGALRAGQAAVVVATQPHRASLEERLRATGLDLAGLHARGRYVALDAVETLSRFMENSAPDPRRFATLIGDIIVAAADGGPVRVYGEMVAILAVAGHHEAALQLEALWNDLQRTQPFDLLCAYPMDRLGGEALGALVEGVCAAHGEVVPAESYSALPGEDSRLRAIAVLQQKARSLENEIAERTRAERSLQALLEISKTLHASLDLETLLDRLVREALHLVGAEGGCAGLRSGDGMVCRGYVRRSAVLPLVYRWQPGQGLPGWLLLHKVPYLTNDASTDAQIVPALRELLGIRSALSTPILDDQGEVLGFFELHNALDAAGFTTADQEKLVAISQMAAIAIQNARLYREAQDAVRQRDEFLAIASHELRTPLTALSGQAELALRRLIRDGQLAPERARRTLEIVTGQADRLARLVEQMLDVSRLHAGTLTIARRPADLVALTQQVMAGVQRRATDHTLMLTAPPSLPATVDAVRLEQVLENLLDNAIRFSPDGGPIDVALSCSDDVALLSVRDHGLGIPMEKRDRIFERFYQAHSEEYRSGLGLGLYLSRQIVVQHGGELQVDFPADGGARFTVRLPLTPAGSADAADRSAAAAAGGGA